MKRALVVALALAACEYTEPVQSTASADGSTQVLVVEAGMPLWQLVPHIAVTLQVPVESLQVELRAPAAAETMRVLGIPRYGRSLEGYLPPGTYRFPPDVTARRVVAVMVYRFEQQWTTERMQQLQNLKMTRHEVVTLASIVQKEIMRDAEGPIVAGVFMNRLRRGMRLQADPTVQYALRRAPGRVTFNDLQVASPYNTYLHEGLPPGPIGTPSMASIDAVLRYQRHPFLFFVSKGDGTHEFTRTYAEHLAAIQRIRTP